MNTDFKSGLSRRDFTKATCLTALAMGAGAGLAGCETAQPQIKETARKPSGGPYNILMIVTDQEQHFLNGQLPIGFKLPGHERLY